MSYDVYINTKCCGREVWSANHTSNQSGMWAWALGGIQLGDAIEGKSTEEAAKLLTAAIEKCVAAADLSHFDSPNGWGSAQSGLTFLRNIRDACHDNPGMVVSVWR